MEFQILNFYEFRDMGPGEDLAGLKVKLRELLVAHRVFGTIIIAEEGFNASLCGETSVIPVFLAELESVLDTKIDPKITHSASSPFRKHEVRIKPEIVTLKRPADLTLAEGTYIEPSDWNALISDPEVVVLDARNDYEFRSGTFRFAVNPSTTKFSELPDFVDRELEAAKDKKIAMFCTGGIRCEKFAPYLKAMGFHQVYQLRGGILKYLEQTPQKDSLWEGECFVFDERISLDPDLKIGSGIDHSQRHPKANSAEEILN